VLKSLQQASIKERLWTSSLGLGAVLLFIFNSLFTSEPESEAYLEIMQQCGRRQRDPESDEWLPAGRKDGLFFVAEIVQDQFASRVPQSLPLLEESIMGVYKCAHSHVELARNWGVDMATGSKANPLRTKNKQAYTTRASDLRVGPAPPERRVHAAELGLQIPPPSRPPPDPIQGVAAEDVGLGRAESPTAPEDLQPKVNDIWETLPIDMIRLSINMKQRQSPSHMIMPLDQRNEVSHEVFQTFDLRGVFNAVMARECTKKQWEKTFDNFFPGKLGKPPLAKRQHFNLAPYYMDYMNLFNDFSKDDLEKLRKGLKGWFDELYWVPHPESDRMWRSVRDYPHTNAVRFPADASGLVPYLALNPAFYRSRQTTPLLVGE
jgi:hypothetical protein